MPERGPIPVMVLGGSGYVAGELLRLLAGHPVFSVRAVTSAGHAGESALSHFPHLEGTCPGALHFEELDGLEKHMDRGEPLGIFAATPHGATAVLLDRLLGAAESTGAPVRAVDLSADFRFRDPEQFAAIYGRAHGAPGRSSSFVCAVPEHHNGRPSAHAAQPGCFTTAVALAAFPLYATGMCRGGMFAAAVTGSSGSGRTPSANTHHPERSGNLYAYSPLTHRHEPEMRAILAPACRGSEPEVEFVAHSGPFVRGIHATLRLSLADPVPAEEAAQALTEFYRDSPFVTASAQPPKLNEVVGTNRCRIGVATRGRTLVATAVIDNLVKGAAGGAIQWMNRLFGLDEDTGLRLPGLGWH
ncbi:MAG: N-acetyl-gamma-glutamyl-phosphate reductase [Acidobacteria bacterium]|nr:N-acetyl-gamma-glutamyl-phosphate reductase [Acidobacteriota bacterium]